MLKIKNKYKLELQTPETIKLIVSTKKLIDKTKNYEKSWNGWSSFGTVQFCKKLYQQKSLVLYTLYAMNAVPIC